MRLDRPLWVLALLLAPAAVACGGGAVSATQLSESRGAIRAAEELDAQRYPRAALHLKLARDQLGLAERMIREGDGDSANVVLARAEADAELAITLAHEGKMRARAREAESRVRALQQRTATP